MSFLKNIARDAKAVFTWLGSSKGQNAIKTVEVAGTAITGAVAGSGAATALNVGFGIFNNWMTEILKAETLAAAAGQQDGSGITKAATVLSTMTPQVTAFLQGQGLTNDQITAKAKTINDALVTALNALGGDTNTANTGVAVTK